MAWHQFLSRRLEREKCLLAGWLLFVVLIIVLPHLYGLAACPPGHKFLGLVGPFGNDQAFYLGWGSRQAESGHLLFEDKFNGYTERRLVFNSLWLVMGWAARVSGTSVLTVFQVERVLFSVFLLIAAYRVIAAFIPSPAFRLFAVALVSLGSGLGAFLLSFGCSWARLMPDIWIVECNVFRTMLWESTLPAGTAFFLLSVYWTYRAFFDGPRYAARAGLFSLVLGSVYPYAVTSVYSITLVTALYRIVTKRGARAALRTGATIVLISVPIVAYDGLLVLTDPELVAGQARYESPDLLLYLLSFGWLSLLAPVGAFLALRSRDRRFDFILVWLSVTFCQIYIPVGLIPFQLQLILGVQVPMVILAVYALWRGWGALRRQSRLAQALAGLAFMLLFGLSLPTSVCHYADVFKRLHRFELPEYIDEENLEAINWLAENTRGEEVVLAAPDVSPYIPLLAHNRVYCADYAAPTPDFEAKNQKLIWLFSPGLEKTDREICSFLARERIGYLYFSNALRRRFGTRVLQRLCRLPNVELVYQNQSTSIISCRALPVRQD